MTLAVSIVFPHQLFLDHPALTAARPVYLVEEWLFFRLYQFHKQKLLLHRATMTAYADYLRQGGYEVHYLPATVPEADIRLLVPRLATAGVQELHFAALADDWLTQRLSRGAAQAGIRLVTYPSPNFLNSPETSDYCRRQTDFYIRQRRLRGVLLEADGKPRGGKWTYDQANRQRFPRHTTPPLVSFPRANPYVQAAQAYVEEHFPNHPGSTRSPWGGGFYPTTFAEAQNHLDNFLEQRLGGFGPYEDAMVAQESILHHSLITPMLNMGLLTPDQVLRAALAQADQVPLHSLEGFVRQILGWREFIYLTYHRLGAQQRRRNYWGFKRSLPQQFWRGETEILPVDLVIKRVLATGYCHHIERLMILGNFLLLCEIHPDQVYSWFMTMFVDAYDWVMVPNVYGMSQAADGGLMVSKPYISGSNYILKMSDFPRGDWQPVWDGLFWRFLHLHREFFLANPRLGMLVRTFDKMSAPQQQQHLAWGEAYLARLDTWLESP